MVSPPNISPAGPRKAAIGFILATLALDALGFGIVVPIIPELVRHLSGRSTSEAASVLGAMVATFALAQLVASPVIGGLSDRFGRRPVMLLSITGTAANYLFLAWAPSVVWLFVGRLLAGVTSANVSTANAYIADISTPSERAQRFGLVGAAFSFGFVIGPAAGGLLGGIDLRLPFLVSAALAGCNLLFGLFILPESLSPERRSPFAWKGANPVAAIRELAAEPLTRRLATAWSCMWLGLGTIQTVFVLSTILRFGWGPTQNGTALALVGVCGAVVQGGLVRPIIRRLGERRTAMFGLLASAAAYLLFAVATQSWQFFVAIVVQSMGAVANPAVRALFSAHAGPSRQGHMMGCLSVVEGLTAIGSPLLAAALFSRFAAPSAAFHFPGAPFLTASLVFLVAAFAMRRAGHRTMHRV